MPLIGVEASLGFKKTVSHSAQGQSTVLGSSATAGNRLSIVARGDHPDVADDGSISAIAAHLSAKDMSLDARKDISLQAGWDRANSYLTQKQTSASIGAQYELGGPQTGFGITAGGSHQATAADTTLTASNSITLHSGGSTVLHGAEVTAPRIDVKAAQLEITSPQNSYDYHSVTRTAGGSLSVPLNNPAATSAGGSFQHQVLKDHFVSTGKTLSGLYAGDQGIGIDVAGNTSLTAGVISSTASREKNHFSTGSLTAQNLENISRWQLESAGFQGSFGGAGQGDAHSWLGQVGQGMAANSMSLLGGGRDHNERTVSHSAVSDNITINTTSISGDLSRDVAHANGALDNKFNAQKLQNQMQASQLGTQLVGEVMGRVSDELFSRGISGFDERSATNNWARALLEAGGNAAVAVGTGGNVGAAAASVFAGTIVSGVTRNWADSMATALTGQSSGGHGSQAKLHDSLMNLLSNGIASAAGAAGGLVAGSGSSTVNVLNGAAAASAIQQYNQAQKKRDDFEGDAAVLTAELQKKSPSYSPGQVIEDKDLPAGAKAWNSTLSDGTPESTIALEGGNGVRYEAVSNAEGHVLTDLNGDTVFRSPNGQYFVVKDKHFYLPTLKNVNSYDFSGGASLGQHDGTIEGLLDPQYHTNIGRAVDEQVSNLFPKGSFYNYPLGGVTKDGKVLLTVDLLEAARGSSSYSILNNLPKNAEVHFGEGEYFRTNQYGRVEEITYIPIDQKMPRDNRQRQVGLEGLPDDVGGHIQACSLGGTCHRFNLFPQNKQFNNSGYRIWENSLRKALQNGDRVGPVRVKFDRPEGQEDSSRPDFVKVNYSINGRVRTQGWKNEAEK